MKAVRFEGFLTPALPLLSGLSANNNKPWFDEHRSEYESKVLSPVKAFVADLRPIMRISDEVALAQNGAAMGRA